MEGFFDSIAYGLNSMKCFFPEGEPFSSIILDLSPVNFSPNSSGFANVAVDMMNCGSDP